MPYGNQAKYDILVDIGFDILRIQCKKSHWEDNKGSISFQSCSQTTNTQKTTRHKYTSDQIDYFATCWEDNVYLIPVDECSTSKSLRIAPKTEKTPPNVTMAEDYLVEKVLGHLSRYKEEDFEEQVPIKIRNCGISATYNCIVCGAPVYKPNNKCIKCARIASRKVQNRPSREELKQLIRENTFMELGRKYSVTDNTVRKWCDSYSLPRKSTEIKKYTNEEWLSI